jgi:hypothetical protein
MQVTLPFESQVTPVHPSLHGELEVLQVDKSPSGSLVMAPLRLRSAATDIEVATKNWFYFKVI